jgi:hypothetical protein
MASVLILLSFQVGDNDIRDSRSDAELCIVLRWLRNAENPMSGERGMERA